MRRGKTSSDSPATGGESFPENWRLTRLAAIPLIIIMIVAISTTKIPILLAEGFWRMAHEARTDYSMFMDSIFLLIVGAGNPSLDWMLLRKLK